MWDVLEILNFCRDNDAEYYKEKLIIQNFHQVYISLTCVYINIYIYYK